MFIILSASTARGAIRVMPFVMLLCLLFVCGISIGLPASVLFTSPRLLQSEDLLGIVAALIAGLALFLMGRRLKEGGVSAWVLLLMALSSVVGGATAGGFMSKEEVCSRQVVVLARSRAPLPAQASHPAAVRPAGQPLHTATNSIEQVSSAAAPASTQPLRLQTIFYVNSPGSSAVINGHTVSVGDKVESWTVKTIGLKRVVLQDSEGKTNVLFLK